MNVTVLQSEHACVCCFAFLAGKRRYNIKLWKTFTDCFNCLPVSAIVDEKIFCCHGGKSSFLGCLLYRLLQDHQMLV